MSAIEILNELYYYKPTALVTYRFRISIIRYPFNPETWIPYHLANDADVQISIYDINGSLVRQLDLGHQQAGYWDGRNAFGERIASGIYFYSLTARDCSATRKMLIGK